jgi:transcriptional regulator with XRE-family HTH domain
MDLVRFGRGIRALRMRRRWRQVDLAAPARVSQTVIARIERGAGGTVPPRKLEMVAAALGARIDLRLSYNGEALDRLLDSAHARLVEYLAALLRRCGWEVVIEATFWIRGERGSVDLLAWHPGRQVVPIVEVKSVVPDVQSMLAAIDRKRRLGLLIARERGWNAIVRGGLTDIWRLRSQGRRYATAADSSPASSPEAPLSSRARALSASTRQRVAKSQASRYSPATTSSSER